MSIGELVYFYITTRWFVCHSTCPVRPVTLLFFFWQDVCICMGEHARVFQ
ncbi:unnamed protein product [Ixodes pacificus]